MISKYELERARLATSKYSEECNCDQSLELQQACDKLMRSNQSLGKRYAEIKAENEQLKRNLEIATSQRDRDI